MIKEFFGVFHVFSDLLASLERLINLSDAQVEYQTEVLKRIDHLIVLLENKVNDKQKVNQ